MKKIVLLGVFCYISINFISSSLYADSWAKTFGGTGDDYGAYIQQTTDKGYIMTGSTTSYGAGQEDFLVVKLDSAADILWAKTFGGDSTDMAFSVQQTSDGGYIVAGGTKSFGGGSVDFLIIKLTSVGAISWAKTYGSTYTDGANAIQQTSDGGYIVLGYTFSYPSITSGGEFLVMKLDATGNVSWAKTLGGGDLDIGTNGVQETSDGGFIVDGFTASYGSGGEDFLVVKLTSTGIVSWTRVLGGVQDDEANAIEQTSDGGYAVAGITNSYGSGQGDVMLAKLTSGGAVSWVKTYGGTALDCPWYIQQDAGGNYIVVGETKSFGAGASDFLVMKLGGTGSVIWSKAFGGLQNDCANGVRLTADSGCVIAGETTTYGVGGHDFLMVKVNFAGGMASDCPWVDAPVTVTTPGITGSSVSTGVICSISGSACTVTANDPPLQTDDVCSEAGIEEAVKPLKTALVCFPNPVKNTTAIKYSIATGSRTGKILIQDEAGRTVKTFNLTNKNGIVNWDTKDFQGRKVSAGNYFCILKSDNTQVTKLILVK
ncbi:MAG: FlgD immunoglobulin-like domain containing protein [bacterium]|nr:FlgD immunoglobulin-like domain containing protein [bacterium]